MSSLGGLSNHFDEGVSILRPIHCMRRQETHCEKKKKEKKKDSPLEIRTRDFANKKE